MSNILYLIRHGENPANINKELSHKIIDYSLTPKGVEQARQTADFLKNAEINNIYSSPLKRAYETASFIATSKSLNIGIIEGLREMNVGDLEKDPLSKKSWDIYFSTLREWMNGNHEARFPGGENYIEAKSRMLNSLKIAISDKDMKNIILVGHGGLFCTSLLTICHNSDKFDLLREENHNCSITKIQSSVSDGEYKFTILEWAKFDHLHGTAAKMTSAIPQEYRI